MKTGKYTVVGITRGAPKFKLAYELTGNIIEIAPPGYLFNTYDREKFTLPYFAHMDRTGEKKIQSILTAYERLGKDVVLCCYEDVRNPEDWCHRLVFAEWWLRRTGELIEELPDPSQNKWNSRKAQTMPEQPKEPEPVQMSMW